MPPRTYDPFDPAELADPYPSYRWLRAEAPVYHVASRDYWVLSRYQDVLAAFRDHATFSSAKGSAPEPGFAPSLIAADPPKHTRLRRIVQSVFTPRALERGWGTRVQQICDELVDAAAGAGTIDGFRALSLPLPVQVIAELLGIPDGDLGQFKRWSDDMCDGVNQHLDAAQKARTDEAFGALCRYFGETLAARRKAPGDDIITLLSIAGDDERLTDKEIIHLCVLLLIAGNETTTNLIGNGLIALMDNPGEEAKLRENPQLLPSAIEEMLRFRPPSQAMFRQTTRDVTLHGQTIPADRRVMLSIASANLDERLYPDGERFIVDRPEVEHVSFGGGIHFCLGSALARLEMRSLLGTILRRTSAIHRRGEAKLHCTVIVRGPIELPIELVAR